MFQNDDSLYEFDVHERLWRRRGEVEFLYTDGDAVEERVFEIVSSAQDLSVLSEELAAQIAGWPLRYHLSASRSNLLRPLAELLRGESLELGAGCGALTRFLGELGGNVFAVEGSRKRARIAAERGRDLPNVRVICDRIQDLRIGRTFDAVTLIGVLEYAQIYGDGPNGIRNLLEQCRRFLKPHGCLILAIENQLGLKYLAGALEDHALREMHGLDDVYDESSVVTFGRHELQTLLRDSGFEHQELLLPLPDYKLPATVIFPKGYSRNFPEFDLNTFLANSVFQDEQKPSMPYFSLERAWRVAARNSLTADLANSFLIVARTLGSDAPLGEANEGVLARHYAVQRRPAFCKQSMFRAQGERILIASEAVSSFPQPDLPIRIRLDSEDYIAGEVWADRLAGVLNRPGWTVGDVISWARPWVDCLRNVAGGSGTRAKLPGHYLDAMPFNLIRDGEGAFRFFDLEWETSEPPEVGLVLFRGLYWSLIRITSVAPPLEPAAAWTLPLIRAVANGTEYPLAEAEIRGYLEKDNRIRNWISGVSGDLQFEELSLAVLKVRQPQNERTFAPARTTPSSQETPQARSAFNVASPAHGSRRNAAAFLRNGASALHESLLRFLYATPAFRWTGKPLAKVISAARLPGSALLPRNPLFDGAFYTSKYTDIAGVGNPWAHYIAFGASEFRNPHPLFDTRYYLACNPDVGASGINPLVHYFEYGASEGRDPGPGFDTSWYIERYPDVRDRSVNPLVHYWLHGRAERRQARAHRYESVTTRPIMASDESPWTGPLISVILPVWNTPEPYLERAIDSVLAQHYQRWRLCIYDDGSSHRETHRILRKYAGRDPRIIVRFGEVNSGIANATNAALAMAEGDYVAMLDHDDELTPDALLEVARVLNQDPSIDALYTDQAYIDADGESVEPFLKPDWSPELFRGVMFVGHLLVVRLSLARELGGFHPRFDRVQDFEFMLRLSEATIRIHHLRKILYYWRRIPGSVAFNGDEKGAIEPLQAAAVNEHLSRCSIPAIASPHPTLAHRLVIEPKDRSTFPKVAIMVRENTLRRPALRSLLDRSTYPNFTVSLATDSAARLDFKDERILICDPAAQADAENSADYVVLMDGELEVVTSDWIERLLFYCEQRDVGCAAPVLVQRDGSVWQAGLVLSLDQPLDSPLRGLPADTDGYAGSLSCSREVSAVSGECLMISASLLRELGGSQRFYVSALCQGADLSLQALVHGRRNILTPRARLLKRQSMKCEPDSQLDRALFADRWRDLLRKGDPFYNAGAAQASPDYEDAVPAGIRA